MYKPIHTYKCISFLLISETNWIRRNLSAFHKAKMGSEQQAIWFEKIELMYQTYLLYDNFSWYAWIDSGVNSYRYWPPPQVRWPQKNLSLVFPPRFVYNGFHGRFQIAATVFFIHRNVIIDIYKAFYHIVEDCTSSSSHQKNSKKCINEQYAFMEMCSTVEYKHLCFDASYQLLADGLNWGALLTENYQVRHCVDDKGPQCMVWMGYDKSKRVRQKYAHCDKFEQGQLCNLYLSNEYRYIQEQNWTKGRRMYYHELELQ